MKLIQISLLPTIVILVLSYLAEGAPNQTLETILKDGKSIEAPKESQKPSGDLDSHSQSSCYSRGSSIVIKCPHCQAPLEFTTTKSNYHNTYFDTETKWKLDNGYKAD